MVKRTVEIGTAGVSLWVKQEQLCIGRLLGGVVQQVGTVPCEDVGVVVLDHGETALTAHALARLAEHGAAVVVCGRDHHPAGMFVPWARSTQLLSRLQAQMRLSEARRGRLWQEVVRAKITGQAANVADPGVRKRLEVLAAGVKRGDRGRTEAVAAGVYWPALLRDCPGLPGPFRRRGGEGGGQATADAQAGVNGLLDYGYAVVRAATARAIAGAGLHGALGLAHAGRSNAFCLADDLMEPLRPFVDARVKRLVMQGVLAVNPESKRALLEVLTEPVRWEAGVQGRGPLMVGIERMVARFVAVLVGERTGLVFPTRLVGGAAVGRAEGDAEDFDEPADGG